MDINDAVLKVESYLNTVALYKDELEAFTLILKNVKRQDMQ